MSDILTKGIFVNFELDYQELSSNQQSEEILKKASELVGNKV